MRLDLSSFFFSPFLLFFFLLLSSQFLLYTGINCPRIACLIQTPFRETCNDGTMTFRNIFLTAILAIPRVETFLLRSNTLREKVFLNKRRKKFGWKGTKREIIASCKTFHLKFHRNLQTLCNVQSVNNR